MWGYIDANKDSIEKFVIDVRYNDGGNGNLLIDLVNGLIRRDWLNTHDSLYILVGDRTYSAPIILLAELLWHSDAATVGTPPASPLTFFSNKTTRWQLPNNKFRIGIASRVIENAWHPVTSWISPDYPAPFSSEDYFSGKDPALEMVFRGGVMSVADVVIEKGAESGKQYYFELKNRFSKLTWWTQLTPPYLENQLNQAGYYFLNSGSLDTAYDLFWLATELFPTSANAWDSLGEWSYRSGNFEESKMQYQKSLALNPDNANAKHYLELIEQELTAKQ